MSNLTRDDILALQDLPVEAVRVPEWGGRTVHVRAMMGSERDSWEAEQYALSQGGTARDLLDFRARFLVRCLCDAGGTLLFTLGDVAALGKRSAAALDRLYEAAKRLSKLSKQDEDALLGNSAGAPSGASGSS